jgi:hypothetical protein
VISGIDDAASHVVELLAPGCKQEAEQQFWQEVSSFGYTNFSLVLQRSLAARAARARREGHHDVVCRLREAAYRYLPAQADRSIVARLFQEAGAQGHSGPRNQPRSSHTSMMRLDKLSETSV